MGGEGRNCGGGLWGGGGFGVGIVIGELGAALFGAVACDLLAVARAVDIETDGVHVDTVEDGDGEGGIAEVLAPGAELDIGGEGGRGSAVAAVDQIEEGVCGSGLVVALLHLTKTYVINDEQVWGGPALEALRVGRVGEAGVEIVEEIDAAGIAHGELHLAGA